MNAPLIWIVFPLILAVVFWLIQRQDTLVIALATGLCALLALLAWAVPIANAVKLGPWSFEVQSSLSVLGRQFVLDPGDRYFLTLIYGIGAFWFFGTRIAGAHRHFIPIGMAILALMVSAMAVEPFLYAALVVEIAVLSSIPMLVPPGHVVGQGISRYLIFQTLALPFLLFAGWASAGVEANPTNSRLLLQAVVFLGLGFAFWLAIFPFYTWVPLFKPGEPPLRNRVYLRLAPFGDVLLDAEISGQFCLAAGLPADASRFAALWSFDGSHGWHLGGFPEDPTQVIRVHGDHGKRVCPVVDQSAISDGI